jgi:hypothetical protein
MSDASTLEQAVLLTYNNLNAIGTRGVCDNLFLSITDVELDVTPGTDDDGAPLLVVQPMIDIMSHSNTSELDWSCQMFSTPGGVSVLGHLVVRQSWF